MDLNTVHYQVIFLDKEVFEGTKSLTDARSLIYQLYSSLNVDKYQVSYTLSLKQFMCDVVMS